MTRLAGLLCLILASLAAHAAEPPIREIAFEGNATTQPSTLLREVLIAVGEPADRARIERSRQAILDLGLFRAVAVREEPVAEGVRVVFVVHEKWYVLPTPRLDVKSDGSWSYGAQLRWNNVAGLNHTLRLLWQNADRKQQRIGEETQYSASYNAPYALGRYTGIGGGYTHTARPVEGDLGAYDEALQSASLFVSHSLNYGGSPSQGWVVGAGLQWDQQDTSGALAPPPAGVATGLVTSAAFRDLHFKVYSEEGVHYGVRLAAAREGLASDYDYTGATGFWRRSLALGHAEHETLGLLAELGAFHGGTPDSHAYALGGASYLRGYEKNFLEGNAFYYAGVEYARVIYPKWRWLRGVALLEVGNVFAEAGDFDVDRTYASAGLGVRVRVPMFVDFELELGWAIPLDGGSGRLFASRV